MMPKIKQRFAVVDLDELQRLIALEQECCGSAVEINEGQIIMERGRGDRRSTAFRKWSMAYSVRQARHQYLYGLSHWRKERDTSVPLPRKAQARLWEKKMQTPQCARVARIVALEEAQFEQLGGQAQIYEQLCQLMQAQMALHTQALPVPSVAEQQELQLLVADIAWIERRRNELLSQQPLRLRSVVTPWKSEDGTGPCACLEFAYVEEQRMHFLAAPELVTGLSFQQAQAQALRECAKIKQRRPRRRSRNPVSYKQLSFRG